ncbi:MAG: hypothetical protein ACOX6T_13740, partial [Myxococcales bacterium]
MRAPERFAQVISLLLLAAACGGNDPVAPAQDAGSNAADAGGGCGACTAGTRQCAEDGWQQCVTLADGCTAWSAVTPCAATESCSDGQCVKSCLNLCTAGARQCSGQGYVVCEEQESGCTDWGEETACPEGKFCFGGECVSSCVNRCTEGARRCAGSGYVVCEMTEAGCTDWGQEAACGEGQYCSDGECVEGTTCIHQCSLGARQCSANGFVVCEMQSSGCTDWGEETPCPDGQICSAGQCTGGGCIHQCSLGARQCSANGFVVCEMQSSGCTGWGEETPCPD